MRLTTNKQTIKQEQQQQQKQPKFINAIRICETNSKQTNKQRTKQQPQ
jgi:hypothetical protein